jgi:Ca2+-binding EF-hand superfamily protein
MPYGREINSDLTIFLFRANRRLTEGWSIEGVRDKNNEKIGPCGRMLFVSLSQEQTSMKKLATIVATALLATAWTLAAQPADNSSDPQDNPPPPRHHHPPLPLVLALDTNHDGVIDANEIANASAALKTLDKNGDGKLTIDEYMPKRPDGSAGPPPAGPDGQKPPMPLIVTALDANGDGVIDASEIANASTALLKLDKNGDGKLTRDEYLGPRAGHPPGPPPDGSGPPPGNGGSPPDNGGPPPSQ